MPVASSLHTITGSQGEGWDWEGGFHKYGDVPGSCAVCLEVLSLGWKRRTGSICPTYT